MKTAVISILLVFCISGFSQKINSNGQYPTLKEWTKDNRSVLLFYNENSTVFITTALIDQETNYIYWFDCYGYCFDALPVTNENVQAIVSKRISAFKYYDLANTAYLNTILRARTNLQANGSRAIFTKYEKQLLQIDDTTQFTSTLKKLIDLDKQKLSSERQVREFHSIRPANIKEDTVYSRTLTLPYGSMTTSITDESITTYYNRTALAPVYKAVLDNATYCINYYNRQEQLVDQLPFNREKIALLLKEKTDAFLLYRGWLELQRIYSLENIATIQKYLDVFNKTKASASSQFSANGKSMQCLLNYNKLLVKITDYKINYLTTIDRAFADQCLKQQYSQPVTLPPQTSSTAFQRGEKLYELIDARGNVMSVVTDKRIQHSINGMVIDYYEPDIVEAAQYAPFGSPLPAQKFHMDKYPYGYNGKENDNEVKGQSNQLDYGNRIYDPRLGRFLSVDRVTFSYPQLTPYQFASNRPIDGSDLDGNEWTTETTTLNAGTPQQTVVNTQIVRVKVQNHSTIVTDAAVIKAKAEVYKKAIEDNFKAETTEMIDNISTKVIYKTEVILDYNPPTADDPATIGNLVFEDRKSVTTVTTEGEVPIDNRSNAGSSSTISNSGGYTVNTKNASTPGDTRGQINRFITTMAITMDGKVVKDADIANTSEHEAGHSAGLNHPWKLKANEQAAMPGLNQANEATRDKKLIKLNFMNSAENPTESFLPKSNPSQILPAQMQTMFKNIQKDKLWTPEEVRTGPKN